MKFVYAALIYKEDDGYWGEFPDLEGAVSQGESLIEVIDNLEEALEGYILSSLERGLVLPKASDITKIDKQEESELVIIKTDVDLNKSNQSVKKTLTIPHWLDEKAKEKGINFSQTLQEALVEKIAK